MEHKNTCPKVVVLTLLAAIFTIAALVGLAPEVNRFTGLIIPGFIMLVAISVVFARPFMSRREKLVYDAIQKRNERFVKIGICELDCSCAKNRG